MSSVIHQLVIVPHIEGACVHFVFILGAHSSAGCSAQVLSSCSQTKLCTWWRNLNSNSFSEGFNQKSAITLRILKLRSQSDEHIYIHVSCQVTLGFWQ